MPRWTPRFFDESYRPTFREQVALHWQANLLMLRSPRAVLGFCVISLLPVAALALFWWVMGWLDPADPLLARGREAAVVAAVTFLGFLLLQHLAFVQAMERTYIPFVREAMRCRGVPVCLACGQRLALGQADCPECGARTGAAPRHRA
jgi:hypothetical protein